MIVQADVQFIDQIPINANFTKERKILKHIVFQ